MVMNEGLFVAVMGLSNKNPKWYYEEPYCTIAEAFDVDIEKAIEMFSLLVLCLVDRSS